MAIRGLFYRAVRSPSIRRCSSRTHASARRVWCGSTRSNPHSRHTEYSVPLSENFCPLYWYVSFEHLGSHGSGGPAHGAVWRFRHCAVSFGKDRHGEIASPVSEPPHLHRLYLPSSPNLSGAPVTASRIARTVPASTLVPPGCHRHRSMKLGAETRPGAPPVALPAASRVRTATIAYTEMAERRNRHGSKSLDRHRTSVATSDNHNGRENDGDDS